MYGLVNRAIEQMVCEAHGLEAWERIKEAANVDTEVFISSEAYDDQVTYQLVGASSEVLGVPAASILEAFGRHWVLRTAQEGYGDLLRSAGKSLPAFLANLPTFHSRVKLLYPHLKPPTFRCDEVSTNSLRLHYHSPRVGLSMFVRGLLLGLGELFKIELEISHVEKKDDGANHDVFLISWLDA
ncbi:MAG: heme NO-binding domain-containing protein [Kofleriaceae bacterium]